MNGGPIKAEVDAKWLAEQVAGIIYNQSKAKFFNVLESQLPCETTSDDQRLQACKNITIDIIGNIAMSAGKFIERVLDNWKQEFEFGGDLTEEELKEAKREHGEISRAIQGMG